MAPTREGSSRGSQRWQEQEEQVEEQVERSPNSEDDVVYVMADELELLLCTAPVGG